MKLIIILMIFAMILVAGCFPSNIVVTIWYEKEGYCASDLCTTGRSFYSWSEAEAYCRANKLDCQYVNAN